MEILLVKCTYNVKHHMFSIFVLFEKVNKKLKKVLDFFENIGYNKPAVCSPMGMFPSDFFLKPLSFRYEDATSSGIFFNAQEYHNPESQNILKDSSVPGSYRRYYLQWYTLCHSQLFPRCQHGQRRRPGRRLLHPPSRRR